MFLSVADPSQVAAARRAANEFAQQQGLPEQRAGAVALIVTELATNLIKHATRGDLVIERFADGSGEGIEILSLDSGPGIADVNRAFQDGYSTAGSPGSGLGAIRRQADVCDLYSRPGLGTAVVARVRRVSGGTSGAPVVGAVMSAYPGEIVCGDGWSFEGGGGNPTLMVVDGAGHGPAAQIAANAAIEAFRRMPAQSAVTIVEDIHRALVSTRGAAVAVAQADAQRGIISFVGVGNISAALVTPTAVRRMVSHNGTAGHVAPRIREFTYPYPEVGGTIVMHSDGVGTHWDIADYPGLAMRHPSLIAGAIYRDHRRGRDDATVVAVRLDDGRV